MEHKFTKPIAMLGVSLFMATTFATISATKANANTKPVDDQAEYTEIWTQGKGTTYIFKDGYQIHYNDNRGVKDSETNPSDLGKTEPIHDTSQKLHAVPNGPHAEFTETWEQGKGTTYTLPDGYQIHYDDNRGAYDNTHYPTKPTSITPATKKVAKKLVNKHVKKHVKKHATAKFVIKVKAHKIYAYKSTNFKHHHGRKAEYKNKHLKVYGVVKKSHKTFYKVFNHRFILASKPNVVRVHP